MPRGVLLMLALLLHVDALSDEPPWGDWRGHLEAGEERLEFQVSLLETGQSTIDIPAQNLHAARLNILSSDGPRVVFSLAGVPGNPEFHGEVGDGRLTGVLRQFGREFSFELVRTAAATGPPGNAAAESHLFRSQEVSFISAGSEIRGTLTCPASDAPHPSILLVSGSGVQDRDSRVFGHRPFRVLAEELATRRFAALRFDDPPRGTTLDDVLAALRFLRTQNSCRVRSAGVLAHSAGGLLAALASADSDDVEFLVLLAPPGIPMRQLIEAQVLRLASSAGADDASLTDLKLHLEDFLNSVVVADDAHARDAGRRLLEVQLRLAGQSVEMSDADVELLLQPYLAGSFRELLTADAAVALQRIRRPVLALFAEHDWQVPPETNRFAVAEALRRSNSQDATVLTLPGMNHLFQEAPDGDPARYSRIEQTISPLALQTILDWLQSRAGG